LIGGLKETTMHNVDEQIAMVDQVVRDKPDAVIFIPVDDVAMVPSVQKLNEARIPVVLVSNPLPGNFDLCRRG
jgi:ribose transport system substrate-binding protein